MSGGAGFQMNMSRWCALRLSSIQTIEEHRCSRALKWVEKSQNGQSRKGSSPTQGIWTGQNRGGSLTF